MNLVYFTHSLRSCWNHGNAHFLRGVLRELGLRGHRVTALEPTGGWSLDNLLRERGPAGLAAFEAAYPELAVATYDRQEDWADLAAAADVVIVHEWNELALLDALARLRRGGARFLLLFHDTHHRAISDPGSIPWRQIEDCDGVLAFGAALAAVYRGHGWGDRAFVWHEAADTRLFRPGGAEAERAGLVWIGNWGDGERTAELEEFLFRPAADCGLPLDVHGVRYPDEALALLARYGARYLGWVANAEVPAVFARHLATVHVPRRFYVERLRGIPTIRVFEALACGIPLVSAPWHDDEGLFRAGRDYLPAADGGEVRDHLAAVRADEGLRRSLAEHGVAAIEARHTCGHRAEELIAIAGRLGLPAAMEHAS